MRSTKDNPLLSIVIPVYNEEAILYATKKVLDEMWGRLDYPVEIIFVDDGSHDATRAIISQFAREDHRYQAIILSRNYGHQVALSAGLDHAKGDAIVAMDADLQDPPDLIPQMIEKWREGYHVVYAERRIRHGESWAKKWTANLFYRLIRLVSGEDIPKNTGDFRLMDRKVVEALKRMPERFRFVRGMVAWAGFRQCPLLFERQPRVGGVTKYSWSKMIWFALDAIFSFSIVPLRIASFTGLVVTMIATLLALLTAYQRYIAHSVVPGFSGLLIIILFFGGLNLLVMGILGEYVGRIYVESKARPLYFIEEFVSSEKKPHV